MFYACSPSLNARDFTPGRAVAVAGTLSSMRDRIVGESCDELPPLLASRTNLDGTKLHSTLKGCVAQVPIVAVTDEHSWPDLAARSPYIGPAQSHGSKVAVRR